MLGTSATSLLSPVVHIVLSLHAASLNHRINTSNRLLGERFWVSEHEPFTCGYHCFNLSRGLGKELFKQSWRTRSCGEYV